MSAQEREFDIIVWGATGFTGELVAEYLARVEGLSWALGGRSEKKLAAVQARVAALGGSGANVGIVVADSMDRASLDAMCQRTRVVASTVGPFSKFGHALVAACVQEGTNYCDITGEPQFIRRMIDEHHAAAAAAGVRIVHCCGFDSIPSDLGSLCAQHEVIARDGEPARQIRTEVRRLKGVASGGTIASIANILEEARLDPEIRKIAGSPYSLNPADKRKGPRADMQAGVRSTPTGWTAPFLMAAVNIKIVHRSHALLHPDSDIIDYTEVSCFGHGLDGFVRAAGGAALLGGVGVGLGVPGLRNLVRRALPDPGEGPTRAQIEAGGFEIVVEARGPKTRAECTVIGHEDPGYGCTSMMLGESARCLLEPAAEGVLKGGVLTPSTGMGLALVDRLRAGGMEFNVRIVGD